MTEKDPNFYVVRRQEHVDALRDWLLERPYNRSVEAGRDRNDKRLIGLWMDQDKRGLIVCKNAEMFAATREVVLRYQIAERWAA